MTESLAEMTDTPEVFEALPDTRGWELIDGKPVAKNKGNENALIQFKIALRVGGFVDEQHLGDVFVNDAGYQCFPHRPRLVRKPDVSFVRSGRYPNDRPPRGYAKLVPDLCVEVVSPNDLYEEVDDKVNDDLLVNVPMVWVANAALRTVLVYLADGTIRRYTADQELPSEPVLPGLTIRIAELFPPPLPPATEAARSTESTA